MDNIPKTQKYLLTKAYVDIMQAVKSCGEAGLDLLAAMLNVVADELAKKHPEVAR